MKSENKRIKQDTQSNRKYIEQLFGGGEKTIWYTHTYAELTVNAVIVYYEYKVKRNKFRDFTQKIAFDVQHNYLHNSENNRSVHCVHFVKINTHINFKCISELSGKQICWSITNPLNKFQSLAFSAFE